MARSKPPITGDRAATRAKLLAAGRRQFSRAGYGQVGVREIAAEAGVNAALINRYFGSKMGLFTEVVGDSFTIGDLLVGDRGPLGERLAGYLLRPRRQGFDPTLVLLHSAPHPDAGGVLRAALAEQVGKMAVSKWKGNVEQMAFEGTVDCDTFAPHPLRANFCTNCFNLLFVKNFFYYTFIIVN